MEKRKSTVEDKLKSFDNAGTPLAGQVAEQLTALIADRQIKVGERLPNEFELAQSLNVGRGTVREAVKILVSRNVLEIKRGRGTFVCDRPGITDDPLGFAFAKDKNKLALDLCEVRLIIEPEIAALAAERATEEEIQEMERAEQEVEELCRQGIDHMEKDIRFHELIAKSTKNQVMQNMIPIIQSGISLFINVTDSSLINETVRTHRMVLDAIRERRSQDAKEAMREHLQKNKEAIERL